VLLYREDGELRLCRYYLLEGAPHHAPLQRGVALRPGEPDGLIGRITGVLRAPVP